MAPASDNFLTLDFLRFFAALAIILTHYKLEITTESIRHFALLALSHSPLFVDLFFIISGFIISHVYFGKINNGENYRNFLIKRVARLWPLHVLVLICYLAIWGASALADIPLRNPDKYDAACIIPHILMIHSLNTCKEIAFNYVSWSISAEMALYILSPALFLIARRSIPALAVISLALSLLLVWFRWGGESYLAMTTYFGFARAIPSFIFGIFLYRIRERLGFVPVPHILLWASISAFFGLSFAYPHLSDYVFIVLIYAIAFFAVTADTRCAVPRIIARLAPLGSLTYGSYMLHPMVSTVLFAFVARHILGLTGIANDLGILIMIPVSFIAAVFSLVLIEMPCRRLISRFANK